MSPSEESSLLSVSSRPVALPFRRVARERFPVLYRIVRDLCRPALSRWFDLSIEGLERLPAGPFILAANHHNYLDGVVLGVAVPRPVAVLVMPRVYHASLLHPACHRHIGSIPVNLSRPEPGAIKRARRALDAGHSVGIFPEGPFSREGPGGRRGSRSPCRGVPSAYLPGSSSVTSVGSAVAVTGIKPLDRRSSCARTSTV